MTRRSGSATDWESRDRQWASSPEEKRSQAPRAPRDTVASAEDAATWGDWLNVGESTVVTTRVPSAVLNGVQAWSRLDGIGQAFAFDAKQLANLNRAMDGIRVVP